MFDFYLREATILVKDGTTVALENGTKCHLLKDRQVVLNKQGKPGRP